MTGSYKTAYEASLARPEAFWAEVAEDVRWIEKWDKVLDDALLEPAAEAYVWAFPIEFREAVHHVLSNAHEPVNFA
ncbi:MAG: acetyl-coenzyme A synthetase N-terminal domain-containing protein, partial [Nitrospinota bacterium]|nr:acetyl-coenzyme A synthetase N-terminal domain-containing protein [Nitrospinota bacterium]